MRFTEPSPRHLLLTRMRRAIAVFTAVLGAGVLGYMWLGGGQWTVWDALYMSVITLSTVGYGETLPDMERVAGARIFTVFLILTGTGALLYLTSTLTAFVVEGDLGGALRRRTMKRQIDRMSGHVVLAGLGATGTHIAAELLRTERSFVCIESNPEKLDRFEKEHGVRPAFVIGDATTDEALDEAGLKRARGLITALSDDRDNLFLVFTARAMRPELRIVAKTVDPDNQRKMLRAGANAVVSPAHIGGMRLVSALVRPTVIDFLDEMIAEQSDPHSIEEIVLPPESPVIGSTLAEAPVRRHSDALVLAVRDTDGTHRYNPPGDHVLAEGQTLIVLVRTAQCHALRDDLGA